jgi:hypothetical protein
VAAALMKRSSSPPGKWLCAEKSFCLKNTDFFIGKIATDTHIGYVCQSITQVLQSMSEKFPTGLFYLAFLFSYV